MNHELLTPRERRLLDLYTLKQRVTDEIIVLEAADAKPIVRRSRKAPAVCATESGYQAHKHKGEDCPPCRAAHAKHERVASARRRLERLEDEHSEAGA